MARRADRQTTILLTGPATGQHGFDRTVSRPSRQSATGPPGSSPHGTHTRWRRRARVSYSVRTSGSERTRGCRLSERVAPAVVAYDLGRRKGSHDLWRPHAEHDRDRRRVDRTLRPHDRLGSRAKRSDRPVGWRLRRSRRRYWRLHSRERQQTNPAAFASDSCERVTHRRQGGSARPRTRRSHCPTHRKLYSASNPTLPHSERWYSPHRHVSSFPRAP